MPLSLPFPFPAKHLTGSSPNNSLTFFISFSEFETTDVRLCILTWVRTLPDAPSSLDKSHCHLFHTTDTTVMLRPLGQTGPISKMTYTVSSGTLNSTIPYHTIPDWPHLQNDLYCVEWDVKLYHTIPYHTRLASRPKWPILCRVGR